MKDIKERIVVVEDEPDILEVVTYNLIQAGYQVEGVTTGEEALKKIAEIKRVDLLVLDLMLPGMDGWDICKILKRDSSTQHIPIIMLTARDQDTDIVTTLELGADDYIVKPFNPKVLIARIRNVLRRKNQTATGDKDSIHLHDLIIHPGRHEVLVKNQVVDLTYTEFRILHFLARHPGWVYTRDQIIGATRGADYIVTDRAIDVQIAGLRKKLGSAGEYIETVRGVGYRLRGR